MCQLDMGEGMFVVGWFGIVVMGWSWAFCFWSD